MSKSDYVITIRLKADEDMGESFEDAVEAFCDDVLMDADGVKMVEAKVEEFGRK